MKQYAVDDLRPSDYRKLKQHFEETIGAGSIDGIYWVPLQTELLTPEQAAHTECHPLCFAVELEAGRVSCELLVRTQNRIRCSCIAYATETQRNLIIRFMDEIIAELGIIT